MKRIGIFSGSFDPVHAGHIAFALEAMMTAKLDAVYLAPEAQPRVSNSGRKHSSHIAHRLTMLGLAVKAHPNLHVLELPDKQFSVSKTLPRLHQRFRIDELFLLCGSDMLEHMSSWRLVDRLRDEMGLIVAVRDVHSTQQTHELLAKLPPSKLEPVVIVSPKPNISASKIRFALAHHKPAVGLLKSTVGYIDKNWLYTSVPESLNSSSANS
jgi:nicotinate-nucleotide adenylyltransferase